MNKIIQIFYISLILIMIGSCSETGLFYSLENEEVEEDNNDLNDSAQFENMIDTDTSSTTDGYYIGNAGMTVYYRDKTESYSSWSSMTMPSSVASTEFASDATTSSMVYISPYLYASRISHDGDDYVSGVFRLDIDLTSNDPGDVSSSDWTEIESYTGDEDDYMYYKLFTVNGIMYINALSKDDDPDDDDNYTAYSTVYTSSSPDTAASVSTNYTNINGYLDFGEDENDDDDIVYTEEVIGVAFDSNSTYWLIYNNPHEDVEEGHAYFDSSSDFSSGSVSSTDTDYMITDIFAYSDSDSTNTDRILISDVEGSIYSYDVTNTGWDDDVDVDDADIDCVFHGFADIDVLSSDMIIIGTTAYDSNEGEGYFQLDMSDSTLTIDEDDEFSSNYSSSSSLYDASITGFLMDENNERLFAYTEDEGVWLNISEEWSLE